MIPEEDVPPGWIRTSDVAALKELFKQRAAELGEAMSARAAKRIAAGEDPETAIAAEIQVMLAEVDRLDLACRAALRSKHS